MLGLLKCQFRGENLGLGGITKAAQMRLHPKDSIRVAVPERSVELLGFVLEVAQTGIRG